MAQVPRTAPAVAPSGPTGTRMPAGLRGIATQDATPIEELNGGHGVSFEGTRLMLEDEQRAGERGSGNPDRHPGRFNAPTQAFAAMMEVSNGPGGGGTGTGEGYQVRGFAGLLTRAVQAYEENAKVIHGTAEPRGSNFSFTL